MKFNNVDEVKLTAYWEMIKKIDLPTRDGPLKTLPVSELAILMRKILTEVDVVDTGFVSSTIEVTSDFISASKKFMKSSVYLNGDAKKTEIKWGLISQGFQRVRQAKAEFKIEILSNINHSLTSVQVSDQEKFAKFNIVYRKLIEAIGSFQLLAGDLNFLREIGKLDAEKEQLAKELRGAINKLMDGAPSIEEQPLLTEDEIKEIRSLGIKEIKNCVRQILEKSETDSKKNEETVAQLKKYLAFVSSPCEIVFADLPVIKSYRKLITRIEDYRKQLGIKDSKSLDELVILSETIFGKQKSSYSRESSISLIDLGNEVEEDEETGSGNEKEKKIETSINPTIGLSSLQGLIALQKKRYSELYKKVENLLGKLFIILDLDSKDDKLSTINLRYVQHRFSKSIDEFNEEDKRFKKSDMATGKPKISDQKEEKGLVEEKAASMYRVDLVRLIFEYFSPGNTELEDKSEKINSLGDGYFVNFLKYKLFLIQNLNVILHNWQDYFNQWKKLVPDHAFFSPLYKIAHQDFDLKFISKNEKNFLDWIEEKGYERQKNYFFAKSFVKMLSYYEKFYLRSSDFLEKINQDKSLQVTDEKDLNLALFGKIKPDLESNFTELAGISVWVEKLINELSEGEKPKLTRPKKPISKEDVGGAQLELQYLEYENSKLIAADPAVKDFVSQLNKLNEKIESFVQMITAEKGGAIRFRSSAEAAELYQAIANIWQIAKIIAARETLEIDLPQDRSMNTQVRVSKPLSGGDIEATLMQRDSAFIEKVKAREIARQQSAPTEFNPANYNSLKFYYKDELPPSLSRTASTTSLLAKAKKNEGRKVSIDGASGKSISSSVVTTGSMASSAATVSFSSRSSSSVGILPERRDSLAVQSEVSVEAVPPASPLPKSASARRDSSAGINTGSMASSSMTSMDSSPPRSSSSVGTNTVRRESLAEKSEGSGESVSTTNPLPKSASARRDSSAGINTGSMSSNSMTTTDSLSSSLRNIDPNIGSSTGTAVLSSSDERMKQPTDVKQETSAIFNEKTGMPVTVYEQSPEDDGIPLAPETSVNFELPPRSLVAPPPSTTPALTSSTSVPSTPKLTPPPSGGPAPVLLPTFTPTSLRPTPKKPSPQISSTVGSSVSGESESNSVPTKIGLPTPRKVSSMANSSSTFTASTASGSSASLFPRRLSNLPPSPATVSGTSSSSTGTASVEVAKPPLSGIAAARARFQELEASVPHINPGPRKRLSIFTPPTTSSSVGASTSAPLGPSVSAITSSTS